MSESQVPRTNTTLCSPRLSSATTTTTTTSSKDPTSPILVTTPLPVSTDLPTNHVLLKIHHFGFSANNITYQALGEHPHFRYFDYHPSPSSQKDDVSHKTHGLIPVWGFATVLASTHAKISVGERVYGYFCPAQYLVLPVSPNDVNKHAFYVPRPHLPADRRPYNQILRCASDPHYRPEYEELTMLYRPLFWTSYWFEDYLYTSVPAYSSSPSPTPASTTNHNDGVQGTTTIILISSASSKTAFCLAYLIRQRIAKGQIAQTTQIVGLTSSKNLEFTKKLGLYNAGVYAYTDDLERVLSEKGGSGGGGGDGERKWWVYVDVAGNDQLNSRLQRCFAAERCGEVVKAVSLGMTNLSPAVEGVKEWRENTFSVHPPSSSITNTDGGSGGGGEGGRLEFGFEQFFMPEWLAVRRKQLSPPEIFERQNVAWHALMRDCKSWVVLEKVRGAEGVKNAYEELVRDGVGPEKGLIWSMFDGMERGRVISRL